MPRITGCRNPQFSTPDNKMIHCEVELDGKEWHPFNASPDDSEGYGRVLHKRLAAGEFGTVAPYLPPPAPPPKKTS